MAARAATAKIPIVFLIGENPVKLGLVASLARPEDNLTGVNFFSAELVAKRLELLRELIPGAKRLEALVVPDATESTLKDIEAAGRSMALPINILHAGTSGEIDTAFAAMAQEGADALFVGADPFFTSRRVQLVQLAAHHAIPASFSGRQFSEIGGLMSYGSNYLAQLPSGGHVRWSCSQRREARRSTGGAIEHSRVGDQSPDSQNASADRASDTARSRR
jgi:putative tryptophan/tyrosine transport system substrate-binding protein